MLSVVLLLHFLLSRHGSLHLSSLNRSFPSLPFPSLFFFTRSMANKKEQRLSQLALEALKDLFINNLLPDRRLLNFADQPLLHPAMTMQSALLLLFEEALKPRYEQVLAALEAGVRSNVDFFKRQCLEMVRKRAIDCGVV
jgi:hypothetical protein